MTAAAAAPSQISNIVTVWRDGTWKVWSAFDAHLTASCDKNWLLNIEVAELVNLGAGQQPGSKNDDRPLIPTQGRIEAAEYAMSKQYIRSHNPNWRELAEVALTAGDKELWNEAIERCARRLADYWKIAPFSPLNDLLAAIRELKDEP